MTIDRRSLRKITPALLERRNELSPYQRYVCDEYAETLYRKLNPMKGVGFGLSAAYEVVFKLHDFLGEVPDELLERERV